jgi:hypothetical protein
LVRRSTEISTSGGSSETDMKAFAVMPCTSSRSRVVMIVTPVANIPSVRRSAIRGSSPSSGESSIACGSGISSNRVSPMPSGPAQTAVSWSGRLNSEGGLASGTLNKLFHSAQRVRQSDTYHR